MGRSFGATALLVTSAVLAAACSSSTGPADQLAVSVLGTTFQRGESGSAEVPYEIVNEGRRPLVVSSCGGWPFPALDRWNGDRWEQQSGGYCPLDAIFAPVEIGPGERIEGVRGIAEPGRFRLRFGVAERAGEMDWSATSGPFEVE